jgi:hypothetical protein
VVEVAPASDGGGNGGSGGGDNGGDAKGNGGDAKGDGGDAEGNGGNAEGNGGKSDGGGIAIGRTSTAAPPRNGRGEESADPRKTISTPIKNRTATEMTTTRVIVGISERAGAQFASHSGHGEDIHRTR